MYVLQMKLAAVIITLVLISLAVDARPSYRRDRKAALKWLHKAGYYQGSVSELILHLLMNN